MNMIIWIGVSDFLLVTLDYIQPLDQNISKIDWLLEPGLIFISVLFWVWKNHLFPGFLVLDQCPVAEGSVYGGMVFLT